MNAIRCKVETLTATFLHVEPDGEARWRSAPFRGLARWWFRALAGASVPLDEVRRREAEIFGTAEEPSAVTFRVFPDTSSRMEPRKFDVNPGSQRNAMKSAIPPGSKATLEIAPVNGTSDAEDAMRQAYAALWVALHFGGVGQRSRRGAGSLRITAVRGVEGPKPVLATNPAEYRQGLELGLLEARRTLGATTPRFLKGEPEFPVLHGACARVSVVKVPWKGTETDVRRELMGLRRNYHRLPGHRGEYEFGEIDSRKEGTYRLGSPLWVRVANINNEGALLVLTLLEHAGASRQGGKPDWVNARRLMKADGFQSCDVDLGG